MANIRHAFVSGKADGADPTVVKPSDWNSNIQIVDVNGSPMEDAFVRTYSHGYTYYIRAGGADIQSHTGLNNTDGDAWKTLNYAVGRVGSENDQNGFDITISIQDAITTAPLESTPLLWIGGGGIVLDFNGNALTTNSAASLTVDCNGDQSLTVKNVTISNSGGHSIVCYDQSTLTIGTGVVFGSCAGAHILGDDHSSIHLFNNYTISGGAAQHLYSFARSYFNDGAITVTVSGTPAFSDAFALAENGGILYVPNITFSGSATGKRYRAEKLGMINVGGSATYFPGNVAGTTATSGIYV